MKQLLLVIVVTGVLYGGGSGAKQELSHSSNWFNVWKLDGSYIGVKRTGSLWKFGDIPKRAYGILEKRKKQLFLTPVRVLPHHKVADISVAINRVYAITQNGVLWGWGREVGKDRYIKNPIPIGTKRDWKTVESVGTGEGGDCSAYTMAFDTQGYLYGWGDNHAGFVYYAPGSRLHYSVPENLGKWEKVAMGCYRVYALKDDGSVWEWGVATKQLLPQKVPLSTYPSLQSKLKRQKAKIGKFHLTLGDRGESHQYSGIRNGTLWLLPIEH